MPNLPQTHFKKITGLWYNVVHTCKYHVRTVLILLFTDVNLVPCVGLSHLWNLIHCAGQRQQQQNAGQEVFRQKPSGCLFPTVHQHA